jgi:hypothetical protein
LILKTYQETYNQGAKSFLYRRLEGQGGIMSTHLFVATPIVCQQGWSKPEIDLLLGAAKFLRSEGADLVTDYGTTDEGEPWFVFCDPESGEVLVHFARMAGEYLACVPFRNYALAGHGLNALLDKFLQSRCIVWPMFIAKERHIRLRH